MSIVRRPIASVPVLLAVLLGGGAGVAHAAPPAPLRVNPFKAERSALAARDAAVVSIDADAYAALKGFDRAVFPGVPLDGAGHLTADLELQRFEVFNPDTKFVEMTDGGEVLLPPPEIQLWRGRITGDAGSKVYIALTPEGAQGYIATSGPGAETYLLSTGPSGDQPTMIFGTRSRAAQGMDFAGHPCAGAVLPPGDPGPLRPNTGAEPTDRGAWSCKRFSIAVETDNELRNRFGSAAAAQTYVATLMGAVSEIYQRDTSILLKVPFLRIWTTTDPWSAGSTNAQLDQFVQYWNQNMTAVERDLAHFLSARGLGGGIAYLNATCNGFGYGVSANLNAFFPYPLVNNSGSNWDPIVVAHELGHNFGTGHTHEIGWYNPIIDGCGLGYVGGVQDCTVAFQGNGTIMSYCHICPGGTANIKLDFGPRVESVIRNWVDNGAPNCGAILPRRLTNPTNVNAEEGDPVTLTASFEVFGPGTFQWKRDGVNLTPGGRFVGVNSASLTISPTTAGDTGNYTLAFTGDCGAAESLPATVIITEGCPVGQSRPEITDNPDSTTGTQGLSATFSVAATGTGPLSYRWRKGLVELFDDARFTGTGTPTLQISGLQFEDAGFYNCQVTGPQCRAVSAQAELLVVPPPPGSFAILSPAPGARGVPVNQLLALDWENSVGANRYEVRFDDTPDLSSPLFTFEPLNSEAFISPGTLQLNSVYYWGVRAINDFGVEDSNPPVAMFDTTPPPPPCRSDWSGDGVVNTVDLTILLGRFGQGAGVLGQGDANGDGQVNTVDLTIILSEFGRTNCNS